MRSLSDCDPRSTRRLILGALPEWRAAIPFLPFLAALVWLTCKVH